MLDEAEHSVAAHEVDNAAAKLTEAKSAIASAPAGEKPQLTKRHDSLASRVAAIREAAALQKIADAKDAVEEGRTKVRNGVTAVEAETPTADQFDEVRADAKALEETLAAQTEHESDEGYKQEADTARTELSEARTKIDARWQVVGVDLQKQQLAERVAALNEAAAKAKRGTADDLKAADEAGAAVTTSLENGASIAAKDKGYARSADRAQKTVEGAKKIVEGRRVELAIEAHRAEVDQAREAAKTAVQGLDTQENADRFDSATKLVQAVKDTLEKGKEHGKNRSYARYAQTVTREALAQDKAIAAAKDRSEMAAHKKKVDEAAAKVTEKLAALDGQTEKGAYQEAAAAVDTLEKTIASGEELTKRDRKHAIYMASVQRALPRHRAAIEGKDGQRKVLIHRAELTAAKTKAEESLAALEGSLEHSRYQAAEDAVSALKKVADAGTEVSANDRGYQRELAAVSASIDPHRRTIRIRRVEAAQKAGDEALKGLEGTPKNAAFDAATAAQRTVESTIDAAKNHKTNDRTYGRFIGNATAKLARDRQAIDRRRVEVEIAGHQTGVDTAKTTADEKMAALQGEPADAAFKDAAEALDRFEAKIRSGEPTAAKDAGYKRTLANHDRTLAAYRATLTRRRHEVDVARHRATVAAAKTKVDEAMEALNGEPEDAAFSAAASAVDGYEKAIAAGKPTAEGDKRYTTELAVIGRQVPGLRARIDGRKNEVAIAAHAKRIEAANAAVGEKLTALDGEPKDADFSAADEAVGAYEKVVAEGEPLGAKDGRYKRTLAVNARQVPAYRGRIERRRGQVAVAVHRARIDSVASAVDEQVRAMNDNPDSESILAAQKAVKGLEQALATDDPALRTDKKHAAYVAGLKRVVPRHQAAIAKQKGAKEVREHRAELDAAKKVLDEKIAALDGKLDQPLYQAAENAVSGLRRAIESGAEVGAKDRTYARVLASEEAGLDGHRRTIKTKWVEAATSNAKTSIEGLAEDPKSSDFARAEKAVRTLRSTAEAAKRLDTKDRGYLQMVAVAERSVAGFDAAVQRRRVEIKVAAHRKGVEAAVAKVDARIEALGDEAKSADFEKATSAIDDLAAEVDGGEPVAKDDKNYRAFLAGLGRKVASYKQTVTRRRVEVEIAVHRKDVVTATTRLDEKMGALEGEPKRAAFDSAEGAVDDLEKTLQAGAEVAAKDKRYANEIRALTRSLGGRRAKIARRRVEVDIAAHRSLVSARLEAMNEKLAALDGEPKDGDFEDATSAVDGYEKILTEGQPVAAKDKRYAKEIAVLSRKIAPTRRTIETRRVAIAVARHRTKVDAANEAAASRLAALSEEGSITDAERSIAALEASLSTSDETLKKAPRHAAYVKGLQRKVGSYRAAIALNKLARAVGEHQKELDAQKTATDQKLAALEGSLEHERYQAAENAVSSLKRVIEAGDEVGAGDRKYARVLSVEANKLPALRLLIRQRRVEAATSNADEKLATLSGEDPKFDEAEAAVRTLQSTVDAAKQKETNDRNYKKFLAVSERSVAQKRALIARRRVDAEVGAHRKTLDAALEKAGEAMQALEGEPAGRAFEIATSRWDDVAGVADGGEPVAAKDRKYRSYLAAVQKRVAQNRGLIARRRGEVDVARHAKRVEDATATVTSRIDGLSDEPKDSDFSAAEDAVSKLEAVLKDGEDVAAKNKAYAKTLAAKSRGVGGLRGRIARRRVEVDVAKHRARVDEAAAAVVSAFEALDDDAKADAIDKADEATTALEQAVQAGEEVRARDKKHAGYLAAVSKKLRGYRAGVARKRAALEVAAHRTKLDAARATVDERLESLVGSLEHKRYQGAENAVSALKRVVESGDEVGAKDRAYGKRLNVERAQLDGHRRLIRQRRVEAAAGIVTKRLEELDGEEPDFDAVELAVRDLDSTIEAAGTISAKDKAYNKFLAASAKSAARQRGLIAIKRVGLKVTAHRSKVDAALVAADEKIEGLAGTPRDDAFDDASAAVDKLVDAVDAGESVAADSKRHRLYLASIQKKATGYKSRIAVRRGQVAVDKHRAKVAEAKTALAERFAKLAEEPKDNDFTLALESVDVFEKVIAEGDELAEKQKAYKKELAKALASARGFRNRIERRKVEVAVLAHRQKVEVAAAAVQTAMEEVGGENKGAIDKAESSVGEFEAVLTSVNGLATRDKKHGKFVAVQSKKLNGFRAQLARQRVAVEVQSHQSKLTAAESTVDERLTALDGSLEHERYQAAEQAVSALKKVIESGDEVAEKDRKYGKRLGSARAALQSHRKLIRKRRVEAASAQLTARIDALKEEPKEDDFDAALEAARVVESTTEAARAFKTSDKKYVKYLSSIEAQNKKHRAAIERRRVDLEVEAHRTKVNEALAATTAKIEALDGTPGDDAFSDAAASVRTMLDVVDGGEAVAAKSKSYKKYLASTTKKGAAFEKRIAARRIGVQVDKHRVKLDAAVAAVNEKMGALGDESEPAAFSAAEESVADLLAAIDSGEGPAEKSKKYAKRLAVERKRLPKYNRRIASKRRAIAVKKNQASFDAAEAAVEEKLSALDAEANEGAFSAAEEAVANYAKTIDESAPFAKRDKKYKKRLAIAKKRIPKHNGMIRRRRVAIEVAAHQSKLEAAASAVEVKLGALDEEASEGAIRDAERAVETLDETIQSGGEVAAKSKRYRKTLASYRKRSPAFRASIGRRKVQGQVAEHRAEVQAASQAAEEALGGLEGQMKYELYRDAESAVSKLKKVAEGGMELGAEDPDYGKELDAIGSRVPVMRWRIRKSWVDAADADAKSKMAALGGEAEESAYGAAEESINTLLDTIDAGKKFLETKKYKKYLLASAKRGRGYRKRIERLRIQGELSGVRSQIDGVVQKAAEAMAKLEESPDLDALDAAESAVSSVQTAIDEAEPFAKKDKGFRKERARHTKRIKKQRSAIRRLRLEAEIAPHRRKLAEAAAEADDKIAALSTDADNAAFSAAADAVDEYAAVVDQGLEVAEKSKKYSKVLKKKRKQIAKYKRRISRARAMGEIVEHRKELQSARSALEEKMAVFEEDEIAEEAFGGARDAADSLENVVRSGRSLGKADKKYRKELKSAAALVKASRLEVSKVGVQIARSTVEEKMKALSGTDPDTYGDAQDAVEAFEKEIDTARESARTNKKLKRYLSVQRKKVKKFTRAIKSRRANAVLDVHRAQVEAAKGSVNESLERLADDPSFGDFKVAEDSVDELLTAIGRGKPLAKKSKKYRKYLSKARAFAKKHKKTIRRQRIQPELAAHRTKVDEARALVDTRLSEISDEPSLDDYTTAMEAVEEFDEIIKDGKSLSKRNKKHKKFLAAARRASKKYKSRIRRDRAEIELAPHRKRLGSALKSLSQQMSGLKSATELSAFESAEEAADDLAGVIRDGRTIAKRKKRYKRELKKAKAKLTKARRTIRKRALGLEKKRVAVAWKSFARHLKIAKKKPSKLEFDSAMEAAERVEDALNEGKGSRNKAYKKYARSIGKKLKSGRRKVQKAEKKRVILVQTRALKRAMKRLAKRVKKLKRRPSDDDMSAADEALSTLERVLEDGEPVEVKSKKYKKLAKKGRKRLRSGRKSYAKAEARRSNS